MRIGLLLLVNFCSLLVLFVSCKHNEDHKSKRGENCEVILLTPESGYECNRTIESVQNHLHELSEEEGFSLQIFTPDPAQYDLSIQSILKQRMNAHSGDALLIAFDNDMKVSFYETDASGMFQLMEKHRLELYGAGYLAGVCASLTFLNCLVLQCTHTDEYVKRLGEGFVAGHQAMNSQNEVKLLYWNIDDNQVEHPEDISEIQEYLETELMELNTKLFIANGCPILNKAFHSTEFSMDIIDNAFGSYDTSESPHFIDYFNIEGKMDLLIADYMNTWVNRKKRTKIKEEALGLDSDYIGIDVLDETLFSEPLEIHWKEAVLLEEQYIHPYIDAQ